MEALESPPDLPISGDEAEGQPGVGRQMGILFGSGILLVVALYLMTVVSAGLGGQAPAPQQSASVPPPAPSAQPLSADIQQQSEALRQEIEGLDGVDRIAKQRELVNLYLSVQRLDLAGAEQEAVATIENTEEAWTFTGNLYYDWMEQNAGALRGTYAQKAIAAYRKALEINPDNLDVRTDMAIAYLYDPDNPMLSIQETNIVLQKDPNHIQANFNRGIMLMQINRIDEARVQFERVKDLIGDPQHPIYQRSEQALATLQGK